MLAASLGRNSDKDRFHGHVSHWCSDIFDLGDGDDDYPFWHRVGRHRRRGDVAAGGWLVAGLGAVGINVHLEVVAHLLLNGLGVNVLLVNPALFSSGTVFGHDRTGESRDDLDIKGRSVRLVAGNGIHGKPMGILLASHERTGPGKDAVLSGLGVDLVGVEVWPVPVPVDSVDGARLEVRGQLDVGLAEKFSIVVRSVAGKLVCPAATYLTRIRLETIAVVIVSCSQQSASLIATGAVPTPTQVDVKQLFLRLGVGSTVKEQRTAVLGLVWLVLGQGGVAVLGMQHGNVVAGRSLEHGELGVGFERVFVHDFLAAVVCLAMGRQKKHGNSILPSWLRPGHPSSRVALLANHGSVGSNLANHLYPRVGKGHWGQSQYSGSFDCELHCELKG